MKYVISHELPDKNDASVKAHVDIDRFVRKLSYKPLTFLTRRGSNNLVREFNRLKSIKNLSKIVDKGDTVLVHYPVYSSNLDTDIFYKKVIMKAKLKIAIIHDLPFLRDSNPPVRSQVNTEVNRLNMFDVIIAHNESMEKALVHYGVKSKIILLGIFDYSFNPENNNQVHSSDKLEKILFAGNLNKSSFVSKLKSGSHSKYHLWGGIANTDKLDKSVVYHGIVSSDVLPNELNAGWGLVWDGGSLDSVSGLGGNYLKYIDPHKTSLYIVSGLPIIVWEKAGIADFIVKNNLGIAVPSLKNINEVVSDLDDAQILNIKNSVIKFKDQLINGSMIKNAVKKAEDILK